MKDRPRVISSTCIRLKFVFSCFILGALFCFRNCTTPHRLCLPIRYGLFFLHPPLPCSPFYGSTTSNSCLGRETNYVCDQFWLWCDMGSQFPPSASRVDQLLFFACPTCSPFYGCTRSNSCLGRETNCICDCFKCGAACVDRVLYFCVSEQWYGWQCLGVFMSTQLLMHTKFPCTLHFFSCSTTWAASFWLQHQGLAKCVLYLCVSDQRYGCQCLGVLMSTCSSVQSFLALSSQLRPFSPLFPASPYFYRVGTGLSE